VLIRKIIRNALMASGQALITGAILFALYYFLLREIGATELGIWSVVLAATSPARLSQLGLSGGVVRFVSKYLALGNDDRASEVVQTAALSVGGIMFLVLLPFYALLAPILGYFLPPESYDAGMSLAPFALFSLWLGSLHSIFASGLDGVLRTDLRSLIMTMGAAIHLALVFYLVPDFGLIGLGYAQVIQAALILLATWWALRSNLPMLPLVPLHWSKDVFREIFIYGVNLQIGSIARMLLEPTTKMFLSKFGGLDLVAYFDMANRMVTQLRGLVVSANRVMVPVFSGESEVASDGVVRLYKISYGLLLAVALPVFAGLIAIIPMVSDVWLGSHQPSFIAFGTVLSIAWFLNTVNAPAYFSNMGTGHLKWNTIAHVGVGFLNLVMGFALGSLYGATGVVAAFVIALVAGSFLIVVPYHLKNGIRFSELFPKDCGLLVIVSLGTPMIMWEFYGYLIDKHSLAISSSLCLLLVVAAFAPVTWSHPVRRKLFAAWNSGREGL
jgi:O-antigen/teichoic acid export membrane protein